MTLASDKDEAPGNPISSMVDIAFLLLIFFLVVTTILPMERDLTLQLPVPGVNLPEGPMPVHVEVKADGSVMWGEGKAAMMVAKAGSGENLKVLKDMLILSVSAWGEAEGGVMLKVDDRVDQQRFIDVLNSFASCGIEKVGMAD